MKINATFFIQIINFWASYWMLSKLLLKPIMLSISAKQTALANTLTMLKSKEHDIVLLEQDKEDQLNNFKDYIQKHYTLAPLQATYHQEEFLHIQEPQTTLNALTSQIKSILIKAADSRMNSQKSERLYDN